MLNTILCILLSGLVKACTSLCSLSAVSIEMFCKGESVNCLFWPFLWNAEDTPEGGGDDIGVTTDNSACFAVTLMYAVL